MKYTIAHVTHEAVEKVGGIGTVLEGLMTSPVYQENVDRSILVGPCGTHLQIDPTRRLGKDGRVFYSSVDGIDTRHLGAKFKPIEWAFDVKIIYGTRKYHLPGDTRTGEADVLLIDVFNNNADRLGVFKHRLAETFNIHSGEYEKAWDYEEYVRLAEPAFYALCALLEDDELPCILFGHEFMGMPTVLKAILDGSNQFRTIFHAHECATARYLVENHHGHDTVFYNIIQQAREQGVYVEDVFGDLSDQFRHALISRAHCCDAIVAVGDYTAAEMHFLGRQFDHHDIDLVYNGLPAMPVTMQRKSQCRAMLQDYTNKLLGFKPDVLMTHVMRPVISKGLWRDLQVCHHLDQYFGQQGEKGVLYVLTSAGGIRHARDIRLMESEYDWPRVHHIGYPDLVGPEIDFERMISPFNDGHSNVKIILVNQFGWDEDTIGLRLPRKMNIADLRIATDVEFGMATYEPFGISPLEPLGSGAICIISSVCGCAGFVSFTTKGQPVNNVLVADYTRLDGNYDIGQLLNMGQPDRDPIEWREAGYIASEINKRLPRTSDDMRKLLSSGQQLVSHMGWDQVVEFKLLPVLNRVVSNNEPVPV